MHAPQPAEDRHLAGIALRLGSATCFALMGALIKLAGDRHIAAPEMVFYRSAFALPVVVAWILVGPGVKALRVQSPRAHLIRTAIGFGSMLLLFQAVVLLPLAEATTITFTSPVFATLLSALLLGDRVGPHRWAAVILGFAGVAVVVRPGGGADLPALGVAIALTAALGQSAVTVTIRQLGRSEQTAAIVFWFTSACTLAGGLLMLRFAQAHDAAGWALLAGIGLLGGVGQILMTGSLRLAPVATVAPIDYLQMIWAVFFGWAIWSVVPDGPMLLGAALIAAAGVYTTWREHRLRLDRGIAATPPD